MQVIGVRNEALPGTAGERASVAQTSSSSLPIPSWLTVVFSDLEVEVL